jgi:L-fuculose-phosphate aldolase
MKIDEAKDKVIKAGHRLLEAGLITRTWGNISCRVDDNSYAITPSGRDYASLTLEDIVIVNMKNDNYDGQVKPSSERGIHSEVYKQFQNINFVIHTHQLNASVVSAISIGEIQISTPSSILGSKVICAEYGISSTSKLRKNISKSLKKSDSKAIIMKNHGALCFGKDDKEAFDIAFELERECNIFLERKYFKVSDENTFTIAKMSEFALSLYLKKRVSIKNENRSAIAYSMRTKEGIDLFDKDERKISSEMNRSNIWFNDVIFAHMDIYQHNKEVNYIVNAQGDYTQTLSNIRVELRPLIDDFAQIVGEKVISTDIRKIKPKKINKASTTVLITGKGALCWGVSLIDAKATEMILEKNCKAFIWACLFGIPKYISRFDSRIMRIIYLRKYSKLKDET